MLENKIKKEFLEEFDVLDQIKKFGKPYKSPRDYSRWKDEVLTYYLKSFDPFTWDKVSNYCVSVGKSLNEYKYPTYYVGKDLAISLWNTSSHLEIKDLEIASPAALFMLPKETIKTPQGDSLTSVGLASPRAGKNCSVLQEIFDTFGDGLMGCTGFVKNKIEESYWYGSFNPSSFIAEDKEVYEEYLIQNPSKPYIVTNPTEKIFMRHFRYFMFNLMYILEHKDEYFEEIQMLTTSGKGFGYSSNKSQESKYRSPIWLGKNYRINQVKSKKSPKNTSSKSPHFRKGHLRKQKYGKGKQKTKIVWIKPLFVNTRE